ncbi:hypothetical protein CMV_012323 [Castanea mollissima]|uniref:Uncharacterized protein n=1 Tax=Castanea mollissima TaxID=60419 RepID=A0A8J4VJ66_9ROSI|nr:hypothetical protein CMV_012323 [Castanea mollissima]
MFAYSLIGFNYKLQRLLGFRLLCALVGLLKTFCFQRANAWLIRLGAVSASNCLLRWMRNLDDCWIVERQGKRKLPLSWCI